MIGTDLEIARYYLQQGDVVAIPTETVYGLAGNALDTNAILKIFKVKQRPFFDPLIVHTHSIEQIAQLTTHLPKQAQLLAQHFMPGALTLLLPKRPHIPDLVTSGLPRVAVRIPNHPLSLALLRSLDFPLAAPSANPFGYISPTTAQHVAKQLGDKIPYILDGGACTVGVESTIVGFEGEQTVVYRLGGIAIDAIEAIVGNVKMAVISNSSPQTAGQLDKHYSPITPILLGNLHKLIEANQHKKLGILSFTQAYHIPNSINFVLSNKGSTDEAATKLFAALRYLDECKPDLIVAELVPNTGLGLAINDRLKRAASK